MGRSIDEVLATLPEERRRKVEDRAQVLMEEVASLSDLRRVVGKAQTEIASKLDIKQPSVSKIERQADLYLSTLRSYVEATGGRLELVVRFPSRPPVVIDRLGDRAAPSETTAAKRGSRKTASVVRRGPPAAG